MLSGVGDALKGGSKKDITDEQRLLSVMTTAERGVYKRLGGARKDEFAKKIRSEHRDEKGYFGKIVEGIGDALKGGTDQSDIRRAMDMLTERGKARLRTLRGAEREQYIKDVLSGKVSD